MMKQMRRGASGWVAKLLLGGLAVSFVAWGVTDFLRPTGAGRDVITAGRTHVSIAQYQTAYQQGLQNLAGQVGRRPTAEEAEIYGVDQQTLSILSSTAVLSEQARRLGIGVGDEGVLALIQEQAAFKDQAGRFSREQMRSVLANAGFTETSYLAELRNEAERGQLLDNVSAGLGVPAVFAEALGAYGGERRDVSYIQLQPQAPETIGEPNADELDDYFTEHLETYRAPEYRALSLIDLSTAALADPAAVTDAEVDAAYAADTARFTTPERRQVQQAVFPDRARADAAAAQIAGGASLTNAAAANGANVTELGLVPRSALPAGTLADAAFSVELNRPSAVVDGPFGATILAVTEIRPSETRPLAEVAPQIRTDLAARAANEKLTSAYNAISDALGSGAPLTEAATQANATLRTVDSVDAAGRAPDGSAVEALPDQSELLRAAFQAEPNTTTTPVNYGGTNYVFYAVTNVTPARDRKIDEVRDRVVADWRADEAQRLLIERAEALATRVRGGETLAAVAAAENASVQTAASITRTSGAAVLGEAGTRAAFSGPEGTVAQTPALASGDAIVLQVGTVAPIADPAAQVSAQTREALTATLRNDMQQGYVDALRRQIPVELHPAAIDQARSSIR